jgi:Zn-finger nucleic acid-binding protein
MNCPVCKSTTLVPEDLEPGLAGLRCRQCGGRWIEGARYLAWVAAQGQQLAEKPPAEGVELPVTESGRAKLCPECGRFLTRAKVGHAVGFHLERCAGCGGIWTDANEWEVLKSRNLHDNLHFVFSGAWQAEVLRGERERGREQLLRGKLGEADFAEVKRVRAWLDGHPRRAELYAVLLDGTDLAQRAAPVDRSAGATTPTA